MIRPEDELGLIILSLIMGVVMAALGLWIIYNTPINATTVAHQILPRGHQ